MATNKRLHEDLQMLEEMAKRAANKYQRGMLIDTFGIVASDPRTRANADHFLSNRQSFTPHRRVSTRNIMAKLEDIALHQEPRHPRNSKGSWWNGPMGFVHSVSPISYSPRPEEILMFETAYKVDGIRADFEGVSETSKLLHDSRHTQEVCLMLTGEDATTPYYSEVENLSALVTSKISEGINLSFLAKTMKTLLDYEAPPELLKSAHQAIKRQGRRTHTAWGVQPQTVIEYHLASEEEKEYTRRVLETDRLWESTGSNHPSLLLDKGYESTKDPRFYNFLIAQIERGASSSQLGNIKSRLSSIEKNPGSERLLGLALFGKKTSLDDLLPRLGELSLDFIGNDEDSHLGNLLHFATKKPNTKTMEYLGRVVDADCDPEDVQKVIGGFFDYIPKRGFEVNAGMRANFASSGFGKRFEESYQRHQPHKIAPLWKNMVDRSVAGLNALYDSESGLEHDVIMGEHLESTGSECSTAAFVNSSEGVMHTIFPNSMMFDPAVTEEDCHTCATLSLCVGMHEYASAVLFDPKYFDPMFLQKLSRTIPGAFEFHSDDRGLNKFGNFVMFPDTMAQFYYNPLITTQFTPVNTEKVLPNMIMFPNNLQGSAYLTNSLRSRTSSRPESGWPTDEKVVLTKEEWEEDTQFSKARERMAHLTGRQTVLTPAHWREVYYSPSIPNIDLRRNLGGSTYLNEGDKVTVGPKYQRAIAQE